VIWLSAIGVAFDRGGCGQKRLHAGALPQQFASRQPKEVHYRDATSQRFGDTLHEVKLLRAGEPKHPWFKVAIHRHFDIGKQFCGCVLHFVDQYRWGKALQKERRVGLGQIQHQWIVEGDKAAGDLR
jgi:hypothetical protein